MNIGDVYGVQFPFYWGQVVFGFPETDEVWIIGCRSEMLPPDDSELVADGMGYLRLEIIDIHKPGRYPERVFYTKTWTNPDGEKFSNGRLSITTKSTFKRRASGFYHPFRLAE